MRRSYGSAAVRTIDGCPPIAEKRPAMILFATQNFLPSIGGTQLYVTGLADALAARGHAVEVYCDAASKAAAAQVDSARTYPIRR
jgi:hypothetical protein